MFYFGIQDQDGGEGNIGIVAQKLSQTRAVGWITVVWNDPVDSKFKRGSYRASAGNFDLVYADDFCAD